MSEKSIFGYKATYILPRPWMIVELSWQEIVFAWQRVFRGWDDRAIWSIDAWLSGIMPKMLCELKRLDVGFKLTTPDGEEINDDELFANMTDEQTAMYKKRWDETIDKIIDGFDAADKMIDWDFKDLDEYKKHQKVFERGMETFTKNFFGLWW